MAESGNNILYRSHRLHTLPQVISCITIASLKSASMLLVFKLTALKKLNERDYSRKDPSTAEETITPTAIGLRSRGMSLHFSHAPEHETLFYVYQRLPSLPRFLSRRITRRAQGGGRSSTAPPPAPWTKCSSPSSNTQTNTGCTHDQGASGG